MRSQVNYALPLNVENLVLISGGNQNGNGNGVANTITGNAFGNAINGLGGNDTLIGGNCADTLTGSTGNDLFVFSTVSHSGLGALADVITDFDRVGMGDDRINLSVLFGPALVYRHNGAFTAAGQVRIDDIAGADLIVEVNSLAPPVRRCKFGSPTPASQTWPLPTSCFETGSRPCRA